MSEIGGNIYQYLLQDPRWRRLRGIVLNRAGGRCEKCHKRAPLQIHHWFYGTGYNGKVRKPWDYRPRQLIAVCRKCHVLLHHKHEHRLQGAGAETHCGGSVWGMLKKIPVAIGNRFKTHFSVRYDLQPWARATLQKYGDQLIESIQACREPIASGINGALNAITFGRFGRQMAANGYDKMFHLFLSIKIQNGPNIRMERNEVISIKLDNDKGAEQVQVPIPGPTITLNQLWQKTLTAVGNRIYEYDPIRNNCQAFVSSVLQANGLLTDAISTFVSQRADNLLPMYAEKFGRWTTDLAAKFNHVLWGHGKGSAAFKGLKQGFRHPFQTLYRTARGRDIFGSGMGGVWPPGPTAPPPPEEKEDSYGDFAYTPYGYNLGPVPPPGSTTDAAERYDQHMGDRKFSGPSTTYTLSQFDYQSDDKEGTTAPPPDSKGSGSFKRRGGKFRSNGKTYDSRADLDKQNAEDKETLTNAIKQNMESVKGFIDAYKNNDTDAATKIVMQLTSKATGNPATAALIPLLTGTADLISRHTNPMAADYHEKTRQYLDEAFSIIPVVGPILENWIAPKQEEKFNAPSDSYTGQIYRDPSKAKNFSGNLWMQDWRDPWNSSYWKIKTPDEMRAYNAKHGTNYIVYGS